MTGTQLWRVVHEPDTLAPWIVQRATTSGDEWVLDTDGDAWLDWRRFHDEDDARRYTAVASSDRHRRAPTR